MFKFSNFKIITKIYMLLFLLASVALAATVFSTHKMRYIDDTYGNLIDGPGGANLAVARASRDLVYINRSIYRLITENTDSGNAGVVKEITDTDGFFNNKIEKAIKGMPSESQDIQAVADKYKAAMSGACAETIKLANTITDDGKKNAAISMREKCDPALHDIMVDMSALTNKILKLNDKDSEDALAVTNATIRQTYILVLGGLVFVFLLTGLLTQYGISRPIKEVSSALSDLAKDNLTVKISGSGRKDEIGDMVRSSELLRNGLIKAHELQKEMDRQKKFAEEEKQKTMQTLADRFQDEVGSTIGQVIMAATNLQKTAKVMTGSAEETSKQSFSVASASEEATANVQTVASATEELSASVREIRQRVGQANVMVQQASQQANLTNQKVGSLTEAANRIGAVVDLISDIASQTNLLALNATIEAARAGDAGKGFAVVASEVKNLAGQTTKATEEITQQIKNIQDETKISAEAISNITKAIADVSKTSSAIAEAVEQQESATKEIARNVSEAAQGTSSVSSNILTVSAAAQKTGVAASDVLAASVELSQSGEALKKQVEAFLKKITTA